MLGSTIIILQNGKNAALAIDLGKILPIIIFINYNQKLKRHRSQ